MPRLWLGQSVMVAAGVAAIVFAAPAAHALGGGEELQYVTTTSVQLPGFMKMFGGHKNMDTTATTTVSSTRTRHDDGKGRSTIVQCDLKRIVTIDDTAKTYSVVNFDDMMNQMTAALKKAEDKAGTAAQKINGTGNMTFAFDEKPDDQTQTIAGMTAHHAIDTISMTTKGTGDCPSGSFSMTMDVWYAASPIKMACPLKLPSATPTNMGKSGNPCMQNMMLQANNMKGQQARIPLKTTVSIPMGPMTMGTTSTVTSVKTQPYDPAYFDVPAGYTKVDAMTTPTHR